MALGVIVLALVALVAVGYNAYRSNLNSLEQLNQERVSWSSSQLEVEYLRFLNSLFALEAGHPNASVNVVNNRFDILWSRVALSQQGRLGARLREYDNRGGAIAQLYDTMKVHEHDVVGMVPNDRDAIFHVLDVFLVHQQPMREFNRRVFGGEHAATSAIRADLRRSSILTAIATALAFVIGSILVAIVSFESRKSRQMADHNLALAHAADQANRSKSSFLTMMSHELRTPMNGVLGMLALTKKSGIAPAQLRSIEQAERSGKQMIAMLGDILDFAALQDENMKFARKPFEPRQLAVAVGELFGSVARREGISFEVTCAESCPPQLEGDFRRLRQVIAHFASYIVETAGTKSVEIVISHQDDELYVSIDFDYGEIANGDVVWQPDIILGTQSADADQFASDALGPAVARGILDNMGGSVRLDYRNGDKISIILTAAAPKISIDIPVVHIETRSQSLNAICRMALGGEDFRVHEVGTPETVNIVLMEAGGLHEAETQADLGAQFPNALIIAIGNVINPGDFDGHIASPLEIGELRALLHQKMAV